MAFGRNIFPKFPVFLSSVWIFLRLCTYACLCMCKSVVCQISLACITKGVQNVKMVCVSVCVHVSVCICVCGVPNIKLVKCKNGICLCVPVSVYVHVSVCGMPLINLVSLASLPASQKVQNVNFFKNS